MANEIGPFLKEDTDSPFRGKPIKMIDNGDGSWSLQVDIGAANVSVAGALEIADGNDMAEGATTDAAIVTDANGTVSGKLRGLVKMVADVWDSVNHRLRVDGSGVTQPVSAATLPLPAGAALEAGGNLAQLAAALEPVTHDGTLTAVGDVVSLPLHGRPYGSVVVTSLGGASGARLTVVVSFNDGISYDYSGILFDLQNFEGWQTALSQGGAPFQLSEGLTYEVRLPPGATHFGVAWTGTSGGGPIAVTLTAQLAGARESLSVNGVSNPWLGFLTVIGGSDGSGNSPALRLESNGTAHVLPTALHDGAQGNLWNAATTGAGGFSDPYTVTQGTTVAIVGHVSAATDISLQLSQDGVNFYGDDAGMDMRRILTGGGDFCFLVTIPLTLTLRLQSSNSVTATATVMTSN